MAKKGRRLEKKNTRRKALHIALSVLSAVFVIAAGVFVWLRYFVVVPPPIPPIAFHTPEFDERDARYDTTNRAPAGVTDDHRKPDFYTVLIIGLDDGVNTDTIMVASYDGTKAEGSILSIPRDALVNVQRRTKKINAAYPAGTLNGGGREGGVAQLQREIKTLIGFIPDFYVVIDFKAFTRIIDAVGGVDINVPYNMRYEDPKQNLSVNISRGRQTLNGSDALKFVRYRRGSHGGRTISDYQRLENQQALIKALLEKILRPAIITKVPEFVGIFSDNVTTDLKAGNLAWFGEQLAKLRGTDALSTYTIPITGNSGLPYWYEFIDRDAALELVNRTINPFTVRIEPTDVDILNRVP
jgi:LCP family protein required for cell wall assembly